MNFTVQDLLRQEARIQDLYFNFSEMKLSITSDAPKYDIWTGNSDMIDSFVSEILKYESSIIESLTKKPTIPYMNKYSSIFFKCESHGQGSFALGRKDPGFVLQYL